MSRGVGVTDALFDLLAPLEPLALLLTQLGDVWFCLAVAVGILWLGPGGPVPLVDLNRGRALVLVAGVLLGTAATGLLKAWIGLPRPPTAVPEAPDPALTADTAIDLATWLAGADGPGFPSGHAVTATVTFGGLAALSRRGTHGTRVAVATVLVAVVSLTRLALGVHYLVDVLAGVGIGLSILALVTVLHRDPEIVIGLAVAAALAWLARDVSADALGVAGACGGVLIAWSAVGQRLAALPDRLRTPHLLVGGVAVAALAGVQIGVAHPVVAGLAAALAGVGLVAVPVLADGTAMDLVGG